MTMHAAKGLEFDTVFVIEADEGSSPYKKAVTDEEIEEERRLLCSNDQSEEKTDHQLCKRKKRERYDSFPFVSELLFDV